MRHDFGKKGYLNCFRLIKLEQALKRVMQSSERPRRTSSQKSTARSNFLLLRNFETESFTSKKHEINSLDLQKIYEFDSSFFVVSRFVPKLRFEKIGARNTFLTASTSQLEPPQVMARSAPPSFFYERDLLYGRALRAKYWLISLEVSTPWKRQYLSY